MTLRFESLHASDLHTQVARYLTELGWFVQPPEAGTRETQRQIAKRLGMSKRHVCEGLKHPACPSFYRARVGPSGRLCEAVMNPRTEAFLTLHRKKQA